MLKSIINKQVKSISIHDKISESVRFRMNSAKRMTLTSTSLEYCKTVLFHIHVLFCMHILRTNHTSQTQMYFNSTQTNKSFCINQLEMILFDIHLSRNIVHAEKYDISSHVFFNVRSIVMYCRLFCTIWMSQFDIFNICQTIVINIPTKICYIPVLSF